MMYDDVKDNGNQPRQYTKYCVFSSQQITQFWKSFNK